METTESLIRTDHPPHATAYKKNGFPFPRILRKVALFILVFILFFNFSNSFLGLDPDHRGQTVKEILQVLERHPTGLANVTKEELAEVIFEEAYRYNHDPKFILALIAIESEFQNWSVSEQGAKGLMQIMPYVAESLAQDLGIEWSGDRTLFNPYLNIRIGIYYLSQLILDFKDIRIALTAYNYGPTYVKGLIDRKEKIPSNYYRKFLTAYQNI
jgi:soluble lytic murein transglycosylase-like protein